MGRRGDDVGVLKRVVEQSGSDESGGVCHVDHEQGADLVGDLTHALVVPVAGVGRGTADDQFRTLAEGHFFHLVVVHAARLLLHVVLQGVVEDARAVDGRTVREVSAVREVKAEEGVASVEHRQEDGGVSLCAGVRLHVDPFGAEELLEPLNGQRFALVHHLATAVVALAGVSFGILVRQATAHGLHDLVADKIL